MNNEKKIKKQSDRNDKNKEYYKKLKKTRIWGQLILFILFLVAGGGILEFSFSVFKTYVLESKLENDYENIKVMASMYENAQDEDVYDYLDSMGMDYVILDKSGSVIHQTGEDTRTAAPQKAVLSGLADAVTVYQDNKVGAVYIDDGQVELDYKKLVSLYRSKDATLFYTKDSEGNIVEELEPLHDESGNFTYQTFKLEDAATGTDAEKKYQIGHTNVTFETDRETKVALNNVRMINLPLWISADINGGEKQVVGKAIFSLNVRDIILAGVSTLLIALLLIIVTNYMLINAIRSAVKQHKIVNLFFEDPITEGKNQMWYLIKGEEGLTRNSAKKNTYAVVNLVFVNYRNYCLCHSVKEGEMLLSDLHKTMVSCIGRDEKVAHTTSSNFALLLKVNDEEEAKRRMYEIIKALQSIDKGHTFMFQAGIDIARPVVDERGKYQRRKDFSLDDVYNNACNARGTLSDTDETGVALFDKKLFEEQKWIDAVQERQEQAVRDEEFMVYYQPKYNPNTRELRGAEALIRWQSPEFGFVTPGRFIPIFEKNGFITEIDHYMIKHVARDQKKWLDKGFKCVPVSVNVSRAHFAENDLADQIRDIVDEAGTPHELIEIELTESAFFDDKKAMISTIMKLKEYGFSVSMDDFGSGYSSLNSLKDMPLDVLKIDAEFFRGADDNGRGEKVVSEVIKLAQSLNMKTVAEGVEAEEQVDFLAREDCDMIQGYFFAKPLPSNEYEEKMADFYSRK